LTGQSRLVFQSKNISPNPGLLKKQKQKPSKDGFCFSIEGGDGLGGLDAGLAGNRLFLPRDRRTPQNLKRRSVKRVIPSFRSPLSRAVKPEFVEPPFGGSTAKFVPTERAKSALRAG
jgi:hypothetical protein